MNIPATPLFQEMTSAEIETLLPCLKAKELFFLKGEYILTEGSTTEQIGIVLSGSVIVSLCDVWGNNSVLNKMEAGGIFAEAYACLPGEPLMVSVAAAEDTTILWLNISCILSPCTHTCACHTRLVRNLLALCAEKNLRLSRRMLHTTPKSIRRRLLSYFSEQAKRNGSDSFEIPYNRQQLADYLSVERSALCAALSRLQKDGILHYHKNRFTLQKKTDIDL